MVTNMWLKVNPCLICCSIIRLFCKGDWRANGERSNVKLDVLTPHAQLLNQHGVGMQTRHVGCYLMQPSYFYYTFTMRISQLLAEVLRKLDSMSGGTPRQVLKRGKLPGRSCCQASAGISVQPLRSSSCSVSREVLRGRRRVKRALVNSSSNAWHWAKAVSTTTAPLAPLQSDMKHLRTAVVKWTT